MLQKNKIYGFNKKLIYDVILSLLISIGIVCMTRVTFTGGVWGMSDTNYINKFGWKAVLLGIIIFMLSIIILEAVENPVNKLVILFSRENGNSLSNKKIVGIWAVIYVVAWLPYALSYYPGGVYSDTIESISYALEGIKKNDHPFMYTEIISWVIKLGSTLGKDITWSMALLLFVQMTLLIIELCYFVKWMLDKRIRKEVRILISAFYAFCPIIPLYAISLWKDTPFCMAVLLWAIFLIDFYLEMSSGKVTRKTLIKNVIAHFLVAFTRNNGKYVIFFLLVVLLLVIIKAKFEKKIVTVAVILASVIIICFIQGPVYNWTGVAQTDEVEKLAIPLQQMGAVVANDGNITEEQKQIFNNFISYDNIAEHYSPCLSDNLKWYAGLDNDYLSDHVSEFLKLWRELGLQNKGIYVNAYLLETLGFWDIDVATSDAYVQNFVWENDMEIEQIDYFELLFGFSFQHFVNPKENTYVSSAWFFWLFLIGLFFCMRKYDWRSCILYVPYIGVWLTLMVATPLACSLRYIASSLFCLPMLIIIPILLERRTKNV